MPSTEFAALLMLATAASFTPGPNTTLSTALAANRGLGGAMRFVCAVPVGWTALLLLSALGLGALLMAWPLLRWAVLAFGVGYMLWLASRLARSDQLAQANEAQLNVSFRQGVLLQFLNIKAWMLALSIVGGWIAGRPDWGTRTLLVLPVMIGFAFFSNLSYDLLGSMLRQWLAQGRRLLWFNRFMAFALLLTALWMVLGNAGQVSRAAHPSIGRSAALQLLAIPSGIPVVCALQPIPIQGAPHRETRPALPRSSAL